MINDIKSMNMEKLVKVMLKSKFPKFRAKQIYQWLHQKQVISYEDMTNLPKAMREKLAKEYPIRQLKKVRTYEDKTDHTTKYLFQCDDGHIIETVLMKYNYGYSVCISSQVGCRMGCTFCASTLNGCIRDLTPSEMLEQIYFIERELGEPIHSFVCMGTGEPFDNYETLIKFLKIITDENGRNLSRRHITVSTCGIIDKINEFAIDMPQVNLVISLHSPFQEKREAIMPVAVGNKLEDLIEACKSYVETTGRRLSFEYSLIQGVNDGVEEAKEIIRLLKGYQFHVNLIPVNPVDHNDQKATDKEHIQVFKGMLEKAHIAVTVRRTLGTEIDAACGQLRNRYIENES